MKTEFLSRYILHNRLVLYSLFFLSMSVLIQSISKENYSFLCTFLAIGVLISFFNKNMTVVFAVSLFLVFGMHHCKVLEGLETKVTSGDIKEAKESMEKKQSGTEKEEMAKKIMEEIQKKKVTENFSTGSFFLKELPYSQIEGLRGKPKKNKRDLDDGDIIKKIKALINKQ